MVKYGTMQNGRPCTTVAAVAATGSWLRAESNSRRCARSGGPFSGHYRTLRGFRMPDWKQIVRRNLRVLKVCSPELTEELAGHLEDNYEASLREGLPAEVAFHRTIRSEEHTSELQSL